jgi:glutathione S-transferase
MLTFYYGSGSPYAWRVWLALEHREIPYRLKSLSFGAGDLKTPEYLRLNPRGKVPAIAENGFSLFESNAIVEYLDEKYRDSGKPLLPGSVTQRALTRRVINEADHYLDSANRKLLTAVLFTKREQWDERAITHGREALASEFQRFETLLTADFFVEELSAADFAIYPMVALALRMDLRKGDLNIRGLVGPRIAAWMARIETLPYFDKTFPPHWKSA